MKHFHEPAPNVLEKRRDVPPRVAAAIDRALEKDPDQRFPSMDAFAAELGACLTEFSRDEDDADATTILPGLRRKRGRRRSVSGWPAGIMLLAGLAIAAIVVGLLTLGGVGKNKSSGAPIALAGIGAYDPFADNSEHGEEAGNVTDRHPATYWTTPDY